MTKENEKLLFVKNKNLFLFKKTLCGLQCILKTEAFVGRNGISENKIEGDGKTPEGIFEIKYAFGIADKPETEIKYIKICKYNYFIDDSDSKYYNRLVDIRNTVPDWKSAERLFDYPDEYAYAVDIGYNPECEKGKGSAIFLHCKGKHNYTAGCIAIRKKDLLTCLKHIDYKTKIIIKK